LFIFVNISDLSICLICVTTVWQLSAEENEGHIH